MSRDDDGPEPGMTRVELSPYQERRALTGRIAHHARPKESCRDVVVVACQSDQLLIVTPATRPMSGLRIVLRALMAGALTAAGRRRIVVI